MAAPEANPNAREIPMNDDAKRIIKKYPNRRLYDTTESKYVTLHDVRRLVLDGVSFCVIDKKSGEDITRNILLQIIIEQEEEGEPLFSTDVLEQLIGFYGNSVQGVAGDFIGRSLQIFRDQQQRFQAQMREVMQNPMSMTFSELTRQNLEVWKQMQDSFFKSARTATRAKPEEPPE
jgi:polyhydroxyalkanoate synthesis repressor PhaR